MGYKKCDRCELNWIPTEDEFCDVCKVELGMSDMQLLDDEEDILCPECKQYVLEPGEKVCKYCKPTVVTAPREETTWNSKFNTEFEPPVENVESFDELAEKEWTEDVEETFDDESNFDTIEYADETVEEVEEEFVAPIEDDFEIIDLNSIEDSDDEDELLDDEDDLLI